MKKILALIMATIFIFTLSACGSKEPVSDIKDSLELLTTVWNSYKEEDKFYVYGGDFSEANNVMDAPGVFSIEDAEVLDSTLAFPAASVSKIDGAASLVHMMNGNTFTAGAYHVADYNNTESLVTEIKDNIDNRQWMCGFPEKLVILTVDDLYVVAVFGSADIIDTFVSYVTAAYPQTVTAVNQSITH